MRIKEIILAIWNYLKDAWEGEDGRLSYKRLSQFIFLWAMIYMIINNRVASEWTFKAFVVMAVLFALTATIITVPQLIKMFKYYAQSNIGNSSTQYSQPEQTNNTKQELVSESDLPKD